MKQALGLGQVSLDCILFMLLPLWGSGVWLPCATLALH